MQSNDSVTVIIFFEKWINHKFRKISIRGHDDDDYANVADIHTYNFIPLAANNNCATVVFILLDYSTGPKSISWSTSFVIYSIFLNVNPKLYRFIDLNILQWQFEVNLIVAFSYTCSCRIHTEAMNNRRTQEDFFINICTSHFIARVRKGYSRFACERDLETEQKL